MIPTVELNLYKEIYERDGICTIPRVFDPAQLYAIKKEAYSIAKSLKKDDPRLQVRNDSRGERRPALLFWPNDLSQVTQSYSHSEQLKNIVRHFLGGDVRQLNNQIYFRESGDGDEFAWHQDICFRTPVEDFNQIESGYLQTIIVVDEITENNGAVEYILGSHKSEDLGLIPRDNSERDLRRFVRGSKRGVKITAKPGDVLCWSVMIVHGSEQNNSNTNRMVFMNGFAKEECVLDKTRFPVYMKAGN